MLPVLLLFVVKPKGDPSLQLTGTNHLVAGRVSWDDKCHSHYTDYPLVNSHITMENHHAINGKINPLFLWPFSIAMLVITRGIRTWEPRALDDF